MHCWCKAAKSMVHNHPRPRVGGSTHKNVCSASGKQPMYRDPPSAAQRCRHWHSRRADEEAAEARGALLGVAVCRVVGKSHDGIAPGEWAERVRPPDTTLTTPPPSALTTWMEPRYGPGAVGRARVLSILFVGGEVCFVFRSCCGPARPSLLLPTSTVNGSPPLTPPHSHVGHVSRVEAVYLAPLIDEPPSTRLCIAATAPMHPTSRLFARQ